MRSITTVVSIVAVLCLAAIAPLAADVIYSFPFDDAPGVGEGNWDMTDSWEYGAPQGLGGDPSGAYTGAYVYGTDLSGDGLYPANILGGSPHTLTTPALDCTDYVNVRLRFQRWLNIEDITWDAARLWVSNNGSTWYEFFNNGAGVFDVAWTQVEYDISSVADNQETVYIRWILGPTDGIFEFGGWNIDDVEILGDPATDILAWIPYTDMAGGGEYDNTLAALDTHYTWYNLTTSVTEDAGVLATELAGKDVFLAMEQELATSAQLATFGTEFSSVLTDFVEQGGTVVVLLECAFGEEGFLDATGLMSASYLVRSSSIVTLTSLDDSHPLMFGVGPTMNSADAYAGYTLGPEATPLLEDPSGYPVLAYRLLGKGAVVLLGFDYYAYNTDTARLLANAVQYPQATHDILLYQDNNVQFLAQQALDDLALSYVTAARDDFNTWVANKHWGLVVVDAPSYKPTGGFGDLVNFLNGGGRAAISTWNLTGSEPVLCAAFGVSADEVFSTVPPIYRWDPSHAVFTSPMDVPDLSTFNDDFGSDADRLSYVSGDVIAVAGYTVASSSGQAAIVIADGSRILNAFLWDESNQDDDTDGVDDVLELIINEIEFLRPGPRADFSASDTQSVPGQDLTFTDLSTGTPLAWYWDFGDGEYSVEQDPLHAYAGTGTYTVTLTASNADGQDTVTKTDYITVGVAGAADFSATPTSGNAPLMVDFTDLSTGDILAWDWDFGDTGISTDQNPSHEYTTPGVYTVTLVITDYDGGDTETKTDYITVGDPGVAAFSAAPTEGIMGMTVDFTDESTGDVASWDWDFGDGDSSTNQNPSHEYADPGIYDVSLAVTDAYGSDVETQIAYIWVGFLDCGPDNWAFDDTLLCVYFEIVQGYAGGIYLPELPVSRAQMATYISRALAGGDSSVPDATPPATFDDVPDDYWAWKYVEYAVTENVVQGYSPTMYAPEVDVDRGQMAVFIARARAWVNVGDPMDTAPELFPDVPAGFWSGTAIEACVDNVVVQGYADGNYYPDNVVTRDQMAVYVARAFGLYP
jgi:PKD repeat protein